MAQVDVLGRALVDPHPGKERFDGEYVVAMRCCRCGKIGYGPRSQLREAILEHWESPGCRALGDKAGDPMMRLYYPRV